MTSIEITRRGPDEPVPDLIDYRIVHRAMTVDLDRLATAAAELVDRPDPARMSALRYYLGAVSGEIESHHHVEDDDVWPFLVAVAAERAELVPLTDDHDAARPVAAPAPVSSPRAPAPPRSSSPSSARSPSCSSGTSPTRSATCSRSSPSSSASEDYRRLQRRFRDNLRPSLLPFLVPWAVRHATPEERRVALADAAWPLRVLLKIFEPRFRAREELLFG